MKKKIFSSIAILVIISIFATGCGSSKLKNGEEKVISLKEGKVTADSLYKALKDKYGISVLVDLIDTEILKDDYKTNTEETSSVNGQVEQMKSSYEGNEAGFISAIQQYFGVSTEDELKVLLSLEYKRNEAVKDFVEKNVSKEEIDEYYETRSIGEITAKHILIKADVTDEMTDEQKTDAEKKAEDEAKDIIKKLNNGEDFAKLAKKYSDDTGTKTTGGVLEPFDDSSDMDDNFLQAAAKLEKKKYTKEPVKSQYGYHIILKEKETAKPKLKDVKKEIQETLATQKLEADKTLHYQALMDIREEKGLKFKDTNLKKEYNKLMDKLITNANSNS